jgi:hypothetical protein
MTQLALVFVGVGVWLFGSVRVWSCGGGYG